MTNDVVHRVSSFVLRRFLSALGFAPQPYDWFAFFEDDDAAGPCNAELRFAFADQV
jgi:hypothetical protein